MQLIKLWSHAAEEGAVSLSMIHNSTVYWPLMGFKALTFDVRCLCRSISTTAEQLLNFFPPGPVLSSRSLVPGHIGACFVLLLRGGRVLSAQSEL